MDFRLSKHSIDTHNLPVDEIYLLIREADDSYQPYLATEKETIENAVNAILEPDFFHFSLKPINWLTAAQQYEILSQEQGLLKPILLQKNKKYQKDNSLVARILTQDTEQVTLLQADLNSNQDLFLQIIEFARRLWELNNNNLLLSTTYYSRSNAYPLKENLARLFKREKQRKAPEQKELGEVLDRCVANSCCFEMSEMSAPGNAEADTSTAAESDNDLRALAQRIRNEIAELQRKNGVNILFEELGRDFFQTLGQLPHIELSRLLIDEHFRILLPDANGMEIKMPVLSKVVYFLFLRHPEGIRLKEISDYQNELEELYMTISGRSNLQQMKQSIADLCDAENGSLNQKISRINAAFRENLLTDIALHYSITGPRGEKKRIPLESDKISLTPELQRCRK